MERKALAEKVMLVGMDGLDPRFSKKMMDAGRMPNLQKLVENGACREDLVLLGGHPTDTPPMWTTLATGCNPYMHGITGFYRESALGLDYIEYNLHSSYNKAEPLWNVTAEAGLKTLVFHWPGSSWPPTSDSPNLMVVDGTQPGGVEMAVAQVDKEFMLEANWNEADLQYRNDSDTDLLAPCVVTDLEVSEEISDKETCVLDKLAGPGGKPIRNLVMSPAEQTCNNSEVPVDVVKSPIRQAAGWANAPADALEFSLMYSKGLVRRPALILKNEKEQYDQIAIFKSKKDIAPIVRLSVGKMVHQIIDEAIKEDGTHYDAVRSMKLVSLETDGSALELYVSSAIDTANQSVWHPKSLFQEVVAAAGYPMPTSMLGHQEKRLITDCMLDVWYGQANWQSKAILEICRQENVDIVFSHFHCVDIQEHMFIRHLSPKLGITKQPQAYFQKFIEDVYELADYYIGQYLPLLDKGWTIIVFSDHGLVTSEHDMPQLAETTGISIGVMRELGYTVLKTDEAGREIADIDWSKTRAVAQREGHIYLNLKGRNPQGIVAPEEQYELEREIISALYNYRDPQSGQRVVAVALRNKDAILLGMGGPGCGDIYYWIEEGFNYDHGDALSTAQGKYDTSVSPIFVACGNGFKRGYYTNRYIKEVDFAPTVAVLAGVRMPADCEGAPMYQLLSEAY